MTKVFVTKYALTKGILCVECEIKALSIDHVYAVVNPNGFRCYYRFGRDFSYTLAEAKIKAEQMRDAKIKALHKLIDKLSKMDFTNAVDK
jgi:hypothetical protein